MKTMICPCCGQSLLNVRDGVRLTPLKARIFDTIKCRPEISRKELCEVIYGTVTEAAMFTIGAHVAQIREKFKDTNTMVRAAPHAGYQVSKRNVV